MDIEALLDDLHGRPFSVLTVAESQLGFRSMRKTSQVKLDWVPRSGAGNLLSKKGYDLMVVDGTGLSGGRDSASDMIQLGRAGNVDRIVVCGNSLYTPAHLQAILSGADGYALADKSWYPRIDAQPDARRETSLLERFSDVLEGYQTPTADELYARLRRLIAANDADSMSVARVVEAAAYDVERPLRKKVYGLVMEVLVDSSVTPIRIDADTGSELAAVDTGPYLLSDVLGKQPKPPALFWNTRFPGNDNVLQHHAVFARAEYQLETVIEPHADSSAASQSFEQGALISRQIAFEFSTENGELKAEDGLEWSPSARSSPVACARDGTQPFRVTYRATAAGEARVTARLIVDNYEIAEQKIDLTSYGATPLPTQPERDAAQRGDRIAADAVNHASVADYRLTLERDHAYLAHNGATVAQALKLEPYGQADLVTQIGIVAQDTYQELKRVSSAYLPQGGSNDLAIGASADHQFELARLGAQLYGYLFRTWRDETPANEGLQDIGARLRAEGSAQNPPVLQITARRYPLPWGILYDGGPSGIPEPTKPEEVKLSGFWGERFDICRDVLAADRGPYRGKRTRLKPIVGATVPRAENQCQFLDELRRTSVSGLQIDAVSSLPDEVQLWAEQGDESDLLYMFCHARPDGETSFLGFADDEDSPQRVTLAQLRTWWGKVRADQPVVFLNACSSGQNNAISGTPFVNLFLTDWRGQAFVGTDWPVDSRVADRIGRRLISEVLQQGKSLREAMRAVINAAAEKGNVFPLMYAIYGQNNVCFADPPNTHAAG